MKHELMVKKQELYEVITSVSSTELLKPLMEEIHLLDSFIAGTSYIKDKGIFESLVEGQELVLRREANQFDDHAILILTKDQQKLGYVPEKDNIIFARLLDAGKCLEAKVKDIQLKGRYYRISVGIYLKDF